VKVFAVRTAARTQIHLLTYLLTYCAQVTLTLLLCQRLIYGLLLRGLRGIGDVVELTAKLIEDSAARYIINNGGWVCHLTQLHVAILLTQLHITVYLWCCGFKFVEDYLFYSGNDVAMCIGDCS